MSCFAPTGDNEVPANDDHRHDHRLCRQPSIVNEERATDTAVLAFFEFEDGEPIWKRVVAAIAAHLTALRTRRPCRGAGNSPCAAASQFGLATNMATQPKDGAAGQDIQCVCCDDTGLDLEHVVWACAAPYGTCQPDRQATNSTMRVARRCGTRHRPSRSRAICQPPPRRISPSGPGGVFRRNRYPEFHLKVAVLGPHLIRNHPLPDGSKRAGFLTRSSSSSATTFSGTPRLAIPKPTGMGRSR